MPLTIAELAPLRSENPRLYESLSRIVNEINLIGSQTGVSGTPQAAPPDIALLTIAALNGQFTYLITDPAGQMQTNLGLHYFLEYDTNAAFPNPTVKDVGPSRGDSFQLGNVSVFWRAYSQFRNSPISRKVNFGGTTPTLVVGGGAAVPPPPGGGSGAAGGNTGGFGGGGGGNESKLARD